MSWPTDGAYHHLTISLDTGGAVPLVRLILDFEALAEVDVTGIEPPQGFGLGIGEGFDGLRFSLLGMIAATALTVPLYMLKRVTRTEFAISCAFGGILGFVGSSIAFLIAYMLLAIQHFLEADSVFVSDHIIPVSTTSGAEFLTKDEKSALAEIEARKILRSDSKQFKNLNFENKNTDDVPSHKRGHRHVDILPWRVKLALAALTILMFGVP